MALFRKRLPELNSLNTLAALLDIIHNSVLVPFSWGLNDIIVIKLRVLTLIIEGDCFILRLEDLCERTLFKVKIRLVLKLIRVVLVELYYNTLNIDLIHIELLRKRVFFSLYSLL